MELGPSNSGHVICESPGHRADTGHTGHNHWSNRHSDNINNDKHDDHDNTATVDIEAQLG